VRLGRPWRWGLGPGPGPVGKDDLSPVVREALQELERLGVARPELSEPAESLSRIIRAAFSVEGAPEPALRPGEPATDSLIERIREGWCEGVAAVKVVRPTLDPSRLAARAAAIAASSGPGAVGSGAFRRLVAGPPGRVAELAMTLLVDGDEALGAALEALGIGRDFATSALRLVLLGELGDWSARICSHLGEASWPRGACPVCGAWPAVGESRGLEQRRFLRCDRCAAGWPGGRLHCPFCGQDDHRALRFLHVDGEQDRYRMAVCDHCGGRVKLVATLAPISPPGLLVAQLATVHLDFIEPGDATASFP
jgi:hypothetical protein